MKQQTKLIITVGLIASLSGLSQAIAADQTTSADTQEQANRSLAYELSAEQMDNVRGGIWDYSNRLGILGQMLEDAQDRNYGDPFGPKTLDEAAHQALEGWVSIP
jgi:hypothetical protein